MGEVNRVPLGLEQRDFTPQGAAGEAATLTPAQTLSSQQAPGSGRLLGPGMLTTKDESACAPSAVLVLGSGSPQHPAPNLEPEIRGGLWFPKGSALSLCDGCRRCWDVVPWSRADR